MCIRDSTLALRFGERHACRLPVHNLPPSIPFDERTAIEQFCDVLRAAVLSSSDETKGDDGRIAVLLNANVFSSVDRLGIGWFWRRRSAHTFHHFGFVHATTSRPRVDLSLIHI